MSIHKLQRNDERGFSLVEMALVMIISGFMFAVVAAAYNAQLKNNEQELVFENARELEGALFEFVSNARRYPCPADPTLGPGDANYGRENCGPAFGSVQRITVPWDSNNDLVNDTILIGSFPFETVMPMLFGSDMSATNTIDPWGSKYTYAVTEVLTSALTYNDFWGTINIIDEFGNDILDVPNTVHAVLVSHGKNRRSGYALNGTQIDPFPILPPGPPPPPGMVAVSEVENANNDGIFYAGLIRETDDVSTHNDDFVLYVMNRSLDLWPIIGSNGMENPTFFVTNSNPGSVGIGIQNPVERLEVAGDIMAGGIRANQICDTTGNNCMPVSRLAGEDAEMQCPPGQVVTAFANNQRVCETVFSSQPTNISCPPGQYLNGFSNLGNVNCYPIP